MKNFDVNRLKIVCASSVFHGKDAFATIGQVLSLPETAITPATVAASDTLITRSKTRIDAKLVRGSKLSFVGTATAGIDHLDVDFLQRNHLAYYYAAGCNANSVAEYVITALLYLAEHHAIKLAGATLGIIGAGHIGSRVAAKAQILGLKVLLNDPPLQQVTGDQCYEPLDKILANSDIITFHVPLNPTGSFATYHLANLRFFSKLKPGAIIINASRGEVIDEEALTEAIRNHRVKHAVLDVWANEPAISSTTLQLATIGTPHIAGYSLEGRLQGTVAVYHAACNFYELPNRWTPPTLPTLADKPLTIDARGRYDEEILYELAMHVYDLKDDDRLLRACLGDGEAAIAREKFHQLRQNYRQRREFSALKVKINFASPGLLDKVSRFGFQVLKNSDTNHSEPR